jgi:hypothetical protein
MERADRPESPKWYHERRSVGRRRLPALVMILVFAAAAAAVWADLLTDESTATSRVSCPPAPPAAQLRPLPYHALRDVPPMPPSDVAVLVRNSTSRHDLASRVAARLEILGFAEAAAPDNDSVYSTDSMRCVSQIRFSPAGRAAARTLSLVAPCAQLVRDDSRTDDVVHLVVGTDFFALDPDGEVRDILQALRAAKGSGGTDQVGGLQSLSGAETSPVPVPSGTRSC